MPHRHVISQGESTVSLAEEYGLFARTIWDHPDNADLKKRRGDMNVLMAGDVVVIPDKRVKHESGATEKKHRYMRKGVPVILRLQVFDVETPRANQDYELVVEGNVSRGRTDANGVLEEFVSPAAREGRLTIGPDRCMMTIAIGHLDPIKEISGVQRRLNNLGFLCGEPDGECNDATQEALRQFQMRFGLDVSGAADDATRAKLVEVHDNQGALPPP